MWTVIVPNEIPKQRQMVISLYTSHYQCQQRWIFVFEKERQRTTQPTGYSQSTFPRYIYIYIYIIVLDFQTGSALCFHIDILLLFLSSVITIFTIGVSFFLLLVLNKGEKDTLTEWILFPTHYYFFRNIK